MSLRTRLCVGFCFLFAALSGCSLDEVHGPAWAYVAARDSSGEYVLEKRWLDADSLTDLRGPSAEFIARPDLALVQDETDGVALRVTGGEPMDVRLVRHDGAYMATDYEGLVALTTYHHISQAHTYFQSIGLGTVVPDLPAIDVYFYGAFDKETAERLGISADNAAYTSLGPGFLVLKERFLNALPLATNEGVMVHEYGHAVTSQIAVQSMADAIPNRDDEWMDASFNHWQSVDEGVADIHAVAFTGDPNFLEPSLGQFSDARDVRPLWAYGPQLEAVAEGTETEDYDPYPLGTVLASTFWAFRGLLESDGVTEEDARKRMATVAFEMVVQLGIFNRDSFTIVDAVNSAIGVTEGAERAAFCAAVTRSFSYVAEELEGCPADE